MTRTSTVPRRLARILFLCAALLLLGTFAPVSLFRPYPFVPEASIEFERVLLDPRNPDRRVVGGLEFIEGWSLTSDNPRFGGISALHVGGGKVTALSDAGWLIRFPLAETMGSVAGRVDVLPDGPGSARLKKDRDSEALTVFGDQAWISFERQNAVWRYATAHWRSDAHARPRTMRRWPNNAGSEAILRLADGRFLVFSEGAWRKDGTTDVLLFDGDPALPGTSVTVLGYRAPEGYRITDAALLPDGRLLMLHRRVSLWSGISAVLSIAPPPPAEAGAVIRGAVVAELRSPLTVDNMEGLSVGIENGRTILWLASDDNYNPLQSTLLMKFALLPDGRTPPRATR